MKGKTLYIAALIIASFSVQGCAKKPSVVQVDKPSMTLFEKELATASKSASEAQDMLARVRNATSLNHLSDSDIRQSTWQSGTKVKGLQELVSFDWVGDMEGMVRALSKHMEGWRIDIYGNPPTTPPMVSIFKRDVTVQSILENMGEQLGDRVDIIINPHAKPMPQIKFIYLDERYDG